MDSVGEADRALLNRTANGDRRAFGVLFDRHSRAVIRYAWALVSDQMDVQEIVQDTFFTTWSKAGRVTIAESSALPWLLVTCRNHALNLRRKRASSRAETLPDELAYVAANDDRSVAKVGQLLSSQGTVYPLLNRLHDAGLVTSYWEVSDSERPRRYYQITDAGRRELETFQDDWERFSGSVSTLLATIPELSTESDKS